jgi:hypothetical protein
MIWLFLTLIINTGVAQTQKKITDIPNISVIGNIIGVSNTHQKTLDLDGVEFSFQHYLYPSVKADIFLGLHNAGEKRELDLEEGYVTFLDTLNVIAPNAGLPSGLGTIVGKKRIGFGKVNPLHAEQWSFVDRPLLNTTFLGDGEGLSGEGVQVSALLPLPFFSQIEWGYWTASSHDHTKASAHDDEHASDEHGDSPNGIEYKNRLMSSRLWNSVSISESQELEFGLNYLLGNASARSKENQQALMGFDITFTQDFGGRGLKLQAEVASARYGHPGEARERQRASVYTATMDATKYLQFGVRYDQLGRHGDAGHDVTRLTWAATRQLTETSKFRVQYTTSDTIENTLLAQFIFGMGPHSHVLQ